MNLENYAQGNKSTTDRQTRDDSTAVKHRDQSRQIQRQSRAGVARDRVSGWGDGEIWGWMAGGWMTDGCLHELMNVINAN